MKRLIPDRKFMLAIFAGLCLGLMTAAAQAFSIDYQFGGTGVYGNLGSTALSNADFMVSITGDTANVKPAPTGWEISGLTGSITISGGGLTIPLSATFSNTLYVFTDPFGITNPWVVFGFETIEYSKLIQNDLMAIVPDPLVYDLSNYDLKSLYGPIFAGNGYAGSGLLNFFPFYGDGVDTSLGLLTVDPINNGSFQAVPVPAPVLLLASGLVGLVVIRRRPKQAKNTTVTEDQQQRRNEK